MITRTLIVASLLIAIILSAYLLLENDHHVLANYDEQKEISVVDNKSTAKQIDKKIKEHAIYQKTVIKKVDDVSGESDPLDAFLELSYNDALLKLIERSKEPNSNITSIILDLIDEGYISVDSIMREGGDSVHYTAFYTAISFDRNMSKQQISQLIEMQPYISNKAILARTLSRGEKSLDVFKAVYDYAKFNDKKFESEYSAIFSSGTSEVYEYLYSKNPEALANDIEKNYKLALDKSELTFEYKNKLSKDRLSRSIARDISRFEFLLRQDLLTAEQKSVIIERLNRYSAL